MVTPTRRGSIAFFIALGSVAVAFAVALNVGWIILSWRTGLLLVAGILLFVFIITGVVLNTIFLVREIRRNEQHNAFINAVTHELKTPVASIRLYLQTLQSRQLEEAKRQEFYSIMVADTERLMSTIEQVLHAGRTASRRKSHRTPLDLRALVGEVVELSRIRHHLGADVLRFSDSSVGFDTTVLGEADELKAAVSNLIDNAVKYSAGHVDIDVELTAAGAGKLAVQVKDRGVGIPAAELKRIFKRFYRIPGSVAARVKGTGLGLFIVQSIVEKHGGKAFAESEGTGRGSTFTIQLPLAR